MFIAKEYYKLQYLDIARIEKSRCRMIRAKNAAMYIKEDPRLISVYIEENPALSKYKLRVSSARLLPSWSTLNLSKNGINQS